MFENQEIVTIEKSELIQQVQLLEKQDYRLVAISCTKTEDFCIDYTFDKDYKFYNLRVRLPLEAPELPSISLVYFAAFIYENELHDLFGIKVHGMVIDFGGKFYRIDTKSPFSLNDIEVITKKG